MDFSTSHLSQNIKKIKGDPLEKKTSKKESHNAEKTDPFVSSGVVCYAEKEVKTFCFSLQGQMGQCETIKMCRTLRTVWSARGE